MAGWLVVRRPSVRSRTRLVNCRRGIQALARGGSASMQPARSSAQRLRFALRHDGRETHMPGAELSWKDIEPVIQGLAKRFDYIEEDLVHLGERVGYRYAPTNSGVPPEVKDLVREGRTLGALHSLSRGYWRELGAGEGRRARSVSRAPL
jgi:hypothetical protein